MRNRSNTGIYWAIFITPSLHPYYTLNNPHYTLFLLLFIVYICNSVQKCDIDPIQVYIGPSLLHPHCTLITPLLHPFYTFITPLLHTCYTLVTPFLHPYYTLFTPLLHPQ
jgi:hypothetical protein